MHKFQNRAGRNCGKLGKGGKDSNINQSKKKQCGLERNTKSVQYVKSYALSKVSLSDCINNTQFKYILFVKDTTKSKQQKKHKTQKAYKQIIRQKK